MKSFYKYAGWAGILTAIALFLEFSLFMAGGFSADKLADPAEAVALITDKESLLRIAAFVGFAGAFVRVLFAAGLAKKLRDEAPTRAASVLYFGILGSAGHGLVALSFYLGFPVITELASSEAVSSWGAFNAITSGFQGLGNILLGLTFVAAGSAIIAKRMLPKGLGWVGLIAGLATLIGVLTTATPLAAVGFGIFMPSIVLAILFDVWAGVKLIQQSRSA